MLTFLLTSLLAGAAAMAVAPRRELGAPIFIDLSRGGEMSIPVVELVERPSPWGRFFPFRPQQYAYIKPRQPEVQSSRCEQERQLARLGIIPDVVAPDCDVQGQYTRLQYAGYPSFCQFCVNPGTNRRKDCPASLRTDPSLRAPMCDWAFGNPLPRRY